MDNYIIKSRDSFFFVIIKKLNFSEGFDVRVSTVGDDATLSRSDCITLMIENENGEQVADIDYIRYNERCSLFEPMKRGSGTQDMVKSVLSLCRKLFGISKFTLMDASNFLCNPVGNNIGNNMDSEENEVDLGVHNLLVYGQSWYERKFGAIPSMVNDSIRWNQSKVLLGQIVDRERANRIKGSVSINVPDGEQFLDIIEQSVGTTSWNNMFESLNMSYNGCVFFIGTNMDIVTDTLGINRVDSWYIPISDNDMEEYLVGYEKLEV